jgi:hypothetical protein
MLTSGRDDGSRVVMMPFAPDGGDPPVVVKTARAAGFNAHTEREQAALATIRASLSSELRDTVPAPLGLM